MVDEYNPEDTIFANTFWTPKACDDLEVLRPSISTLGAKENILVRKGGREG